MLKKSVFFRIGYLILCGCLILGLLPGLPAKALTEIAAVEISNVTAPVSGAAPDYDLSCGAGYSVQSIVWTDSIGDSVSSFIGGEKYEIAVTVKANGDSVFKTDENGAPLVSATVNGHSAGYCKAASGMSGDLYAVVHYSFTATEQSHPGQTELSKVSISGLTVPIAGIAPDFTASANSGCSVDSVAWTYLNPASGSATTMGSSDRFVAGGQYKVTVILRAGSAYSFAPSVSGTINGVSASCQSVSGRDPGEYIQCTYTYTLAQGNQITHAEIAGLTVPVKGGRPDYTITVLSSAHYTVNEVSWKRWKASESETDSVAIGTREVFQSGYCYQVSITLKAKNNYAFAVDAQGKPFVSGTINGEPSLPGTSVAGKSASQYVNIRFTYTLEAKIIDTVVIDGVVDPVAGDRPNALADVPQDALYSVVNVSWECFDDSQEPAEFVTMSPYAIFAAGLDYRVNVYLKAADGAEFAVDNAGNPTVTGTVNGQAGVASHYAEGMPAQNLICFTYSYPLLREEIMQVDISGIAEPAPGSKPDYEADEMEEAQYEVEKIIWEHLDTEQTPAEFVKMDPNDKFENHHDYRVTVIVKAKKGGMFFINEFEDLQVSGTINGEPTIPAEPVEKKSPKEYVSIFYDFSLSTDAKTIKRVNLYNLDAPTPGEVPDFTLEPEKTAKYSVEEVIWERLANRTSTTAAATLTEDDVFQEGTYYRVKIILCTDEGYAFQTNISGRPEVTATINSGTGLSAERVNGKESKEYICVSFVYGVYTVIDGDAGQWSPGDGELKFRFSGKNKNILNVHVDKKALKKSTDYTAAEDSDIIVLKEDFLDSLSNGSHEITVEYTDGIVSAKFAVSGSVNQGTDEEKSVSSWIWILPLAVAILCGMVAVVIYLRRKENSRNYEEVYEEYDDDEDE